MTFLNQLFQIFLLFCFFIHINSQQTLIKAKDLDSFCDTNLYQIIINVKLINPLNEYKSFYLNVKHEENLLFKCIIDPKNSQIRCITNLEQQKVFLKEDDSLILPYPFPDVEGIIWDFPTFVTIIYRRVIIIKNGCGTTVIKSSLNKVNPNKWDLLTKINKIYDGQCLLADEQEDNYYSFMMNLNILGGNLFDTLSSTKNTEISFLQNITIPFTIGNLQTIGSGLKNYYQHEYYKTAFCYPMEEIKSTNYQKADGFDFKCNIPLKENYLFNGPLKIYTFSDNIYAKITSEANSEKTDYISIYFSTEKNPSINNNIDENTEEKGEKIDNKDENDDDNDNDENDKNNNNDNKEDLNEEFIKNKPLPSSSSSSSNLRRIDEKKIVKSNKEYLLLDNKKSNFICPDMPVFEISNIKDGISYEPNPENINKYGVILKGYLKNGFKVTENKIIPMEFTTQDIKFTISIMNNLAEKVSEKKSNINCFLKSGTMFLKNELTEIKCQGEKKEQTEKQNTDLSINWASKENKYLKNIVIKWPKDLTDIKVHSKKIYSYEIYALSIKKTDYDCFNNKFYFYIDILDINSEPQINFNISLLNPSQMPAQCKLYSSDTLKCFLDLKLKKVSKGTNIRLPLPGNYNISTSEGNYINFTVFNFIDENETEVADEGIITHKSCGRNVMVGTVQNMGFNYLSAIVIIICFFIVAGIIFVCVVFCIAYQITHIKTKEGYFPHVEEKHKEVNITANTTTNPNNTNQNKTLGIGMPGKV